MVGLGSDFAAIALVAAPAAAGGWALVGGLVPRGRGRRAGRPGRRLDRHQTAASLVVAVLAAVSAALAPVVGVFWAAVALNHLLGRGEHVPFSNYPMFSRPGRVWTLRFEDAAGTPVVITRMGIAPHVARKRFQSVAAKAAAGGAAADIVAARNAAVDDLVAWIDERRPASGPLADVPISIVLLEYELAGSAITTSRSVLAVAAPAGTATSA